MKSSSKKSKEQQLIIVDRENQVLGYQPRSKCHAGAGLLHRAFSIFLFNSQGECLLQRRSTRKLLWPNYWSNACCSHPLAGETTSLAACRRLKEELGVTSPLKYLFTFCYRASFQDIGSEYEMCEVFLAVSDQTILPNQQEISGTRFVSFRQLEDEIAQAPTQFTPWFLLEWRRIRSEYLTELPLPCTTPL